MNYYSLQRSCLFLITLLSTMLFSVSSQAQKEDNDVFYTANQEQEHEQWLQFRPKSDKSNGKHIVFVSGDEEYRSEESLPMLAQILTEFHGFKTTVLFSIDPVTGLVDPAYTQNIPGLNMLATASLLVIATRFRELPDAQMRHIDEYLKAGKPVIGFRTATHAFNFGEKSKSRYVKYGYSSKVKGWEGGFGKKILGETWISHHGVHGEEGTKALIDSVSKRNEHAILSQVSAIWGPTDVYTVSTLPEDAEVLLWGQSTKGMGAKSPVNLQKSLMPIAWTSSYKVKWRRRGKVFTTTMGSAVDFLSDDLRRLIVNACYWATDLDFEARDEIKVDIVGEYEPSEFGFGTFKKGRLPRDFVNP